MLVTKSDFAKKAGVTRQTLTPLTKEGAELYSALCDNKIDTASEVAKSYLRKKGVDPETAFIPAGVTNAPRTVERGTTRNIQLNEIEQMTLAQVVDLFGTDADFEKWTKARKTIADIREKDLKNAKEEGLLVSRELIKTGIIEPFDSAHTRMLSDGARTIAVSVVELHQAGKSMSEIERFVSKTITSFITPTKSKVARIMKNI